MEIIPVTVTGNTRKVGIAVFIAARGVISLGFVWGLYELAVKEFSDLLNSFNGLSFLKFADYALPMLGIFVAIGVLTGVGGSLITMRKYLNKEGSEISGI